MSRSGSWPRRVRGILNPSARSGRAGRVLEARGWLGHSIEWLVSRSAEHLGELVRSAQAEGFDAVALAGGDGTVALAARALDLPNKVPLAIVPAGSGNDFAGDLGAFRDSQSMHALLAGGRTRRVDLARVEPGGLRYACVASVGFDSLALETVHRSWLPRSRLLNVYAAVAAIWRYRPVALRVTWEDGTFEGEAMLAAVTNTRGYGGGFLLCPSARIDDGRLDLCILGPMARTRMLARFPRIFRGTHAELPGVLLAASSWVRIESLDGPLPVALDGELPELATPVEIVCVPRALRVLVPGEEE